MKEKKVISLEDKMWIRLLSENIRRVVYTSMILVIGLPALFLLYMLFPVSESVRLIFQGAFISFEIVSIAFLILSSKAMMKRDYDMTFFAVYSFWGFVEFFGFLISFILYYEQQDLTVYYMTLAAVTIIALMSTKVMWIYVGFEMVFTLVLMYTLKMPPHQIVGVGMANGMFILLSRVLYNSQVSSHSMEQQVRSMEKDSEEDPLTGMLNRRGLEHKIRSSWDQAVRNKHIVAVIMMDIDNFKKYNDTFGHPQGDECLKRVSAAVKKAAMRSTDVCARVGGEEFLVFIPEAANEVEALKLAEKIRKTVEGLKIPHAPTVSNEFVTISVGVAYLVPDESDTLQKLYGEADKSLYFAKRNGRNCIVCGKYLYNKDGAHQINTKDMPEKK